MNFWQLVMLMVWFAVFALLVFIVVATFVDLLRRSDLSGWAKVLWTILIVLLPLVGVLGYLIARPALTRDEAVAVAHYDAAVLADGSSVAEEIADLAKLRNDGDITEDEYRQLKTKLV